MSSMRTEYSGMTLTCQLFAGIFGRGCHSLSLPGLHQGAAGKFIDARRIQLAAAGGGDPCGAAVPAPNRATAAHWSDGGRVLVLRGADEREQRGLVRLFPAVGVLDRAGACHL